MSSPATRHSTRKQVLTDLRRSEILTAAIAVFGRKGFAATSVDEIAVAAKIAKGTLYLYFDSKEEIYATAVHLAVSQLQELSGERLQAARGLRQKLAIAIAVRMNFWHERPSLYRLVLTVGRESRHLRQTHELLRAGHAHFLSILQEGVGAGEISGRSASPQDLSALSWAILDMVRGFSERRMDRVSDPLTLSTPQQDAELITAVALHQLGLGSAADDSRFGSSPHAPPSASQ